MTLPFTYCFPCSDSKTWTVSFEIDKKIWVFENCEGPYKTSCFDTTTQTWDHQTVTNKRNHFFGFRNKEKSVRTAVLNGKGYVWGQSHLMEFDPVTQIWSNTGHMFRNINNVENLVPDIVQMGDCLYTFVIEFGQRKSLYLLTLNMQAGERTVQDVSHVHAFEWGLRLIPYNNTIYMNGMQYLFELDGRNTKIIRTTGVKDLHSEGFDSCSIVDNLAYFFKCDDQKIRVLNMDSLEWTSIDLDYQHIELKLVVEEIFPINGVFYALWHNIERRGIVMIEPKPSLSTICLLTLANQFTEDPIIRGKMMARYSTDPIEYQPFLEFKQQLPCPLSEKFDNLILGKIMNQPSRVKID